MKVFKSSITAMTKLVAGLIVIVAVVAVIVGILAYNQFSSPNVLPTPTPTTTPSPNAKIEISYAVTEKESIPYKIGGNSYTEYPEAGKIFVEYNMTITNSGYESFSTNPNYFHTIVDQTHQWTYSSITQTLECWDTVDILDGEVFTGTLYFQIPATYTSLSIEHDNPNINYNIIMTQS